MIQLMNKSLLFTFILRIILSYQWYLFKQSFESGSNITIYEKLLTEQNLYIFGIYDSARGVKCDHINHTLLQRKKFSNEALMCMISQWTVHIWDHWKIFNVIGNFFNYKIKIYRSDSLKIVYAGDTIWFDTLIMQKYNASERLWFKVLVAS